MSKRQKELCSSEKNAIANLRKKMKILKEQNEILKRALLILGQR